MRDPGTKNAHNPFAANYIHPSIYRAYAQVVNNTWSVDYHCSELPRLTFPFALVGAGDGVAVAVLLMSDLGFLRSTLAVP